MSAPLRRAQDIATAVRGDKSKDPAKKVDEQADAFDRATESIEKHIARLQADAQAEGLGAAAQAQMRAEATPDQSQPDVNAREPMRRARRHLWFGQSYIV